MGSAWDNFENCVPLFMEMIVWVIIAFQPKSELTILALRRVTNPKEPGLIP